MAYNKLEKFQIFQCMSIPTLLIDYEQSCKYELSVAELHTERRGGGGGRETDFKL